MNSRKFAPALSILALAGSVEARKEAAFADLSRGIVQCLQHGNRNVLTDTYEALQTITGAQGKRVLAMVDTARGAAFAQFDEQKRQPAEIAEQRGAVILLECIAAYDAAEAAAIVAKAEKAAERAKAKAKELKAAEKAAPTAPVTAPLTLADHAAALRMACAAGSADALLLVESLMAEFFEVATV